MNAINIDPQDLKELLSKSEPVGFFEKILQHYTEAHRLVLREYNEYWKVFSKKYGLKDDVEYRIDKDNNRLTY